MGKTSAAALAIGAIRPPTARYAAQPWHGGNFIEPLASEVRSGREDSARRMEVPPMSQTIDKLLDFILAAKSKGVADGEIVALLKQNGWSERRIYDAFSTYYEGELGVPIPARGTRVEDARDAFYYLLAFITLGFWTVALVLFADQFVDHVFPDTAAWAGNASYFRSAVAGQLASLIVAFPLFLFVSRLIAREVARRPEALESGVRKWLTYIALVITACTLLGDAVWFLTTFLTGDLTVRFAWKAFVLFVVAAGVFSYYLGIVRAESTAPWRDRAYASAATAMVVVALVLGFTAAGTPSRQRDLTLDESRINRLSLLAGSIAEYWQQKNHTLPSSLRALPDGATISDLDTGQKFEYYPKGGSKYQVCATFRAASATTDAMWSHPAGRHCFQKDAALDAAP